MKKQLVMLAGSEKLPAQCGSNFIPCPCALSGPDGLPHKGNKSKTTDFYETRYKKFSVIVSGVPSGWIPVSDFGGNVPYSDCSTTRRFNFQAVY